MNNKKNILVTGADGQLGMEFRLLEKKYSNYNFLFVGKHELSITDNVSIEIFFSKHTIAYCFNCAAYTAVDKAETEEALAFEINAKASADLAAICKKNNTLFIHISTDYVFNGNGKVAYKETDNADPVNTYGSSKLAGEIGVFKNNDQSIVIRTSWVYSSYGKNFVRTMLRLMSEKESIAVVNDQVGSPTYAADLAESILQIISGDKGPVPGIYHYCNEGVISWYEFALEIKKQIGSNCLVNPIGTADYPTPAKRPHYSVLDTTKIRNTFDLTIPKWNDSLAKCIALLTNKH